ncbi:MAG: hypothetical protein LAO19_19510, partial [Acidobacteriia bacterium]|nr:hypothetical protein [Terriglobia bacterium]
PQDHDAPTSHADDSGRYEIPASRGSIPVPRTSTQCSFCDATERRLVSGMGTTGKPVAICASCAARLTPVAAEVVCDFCGQLAPETAHDRGATVCKDCIDLALTIFGDADG